MTASSYLASLNGRQQVTFPIGGPGQPAAVYPGTIASATWRMQVRSSATANGTLLLDSQVGGTWAYVGGAAPAVTFQWPTSAAAVIPPGSAAFDVLFIFPGADAELATAGSVAFTHGVTQAGVSGSPAAPAGADDTWTLVGAPVAPTSPSLASAVAAANSSAAAAANSQTAAGASAPAAAGSATSASGSATIATTEAAAAATSAGNASASAATATTAASAAAASATAATTEAAAAAASATAAALAVGATVATSVTGLAALNPSFATAILIQSGRFGQFNWVGGNLATQVANDPGQGIYVAWSGDSAPGATGAWVRQYGQSVDWQWWGAVDDCQVTQDPVTWVTTIVSTGTNNYQAFVYWQTWAIYQSTLGIGVYVEPSVKNTGVYGWTQQNVTPPTPGGLYWTSGIKKLHINGHKRVAMQNVTNAGQPFAIGAYASLTPYLINQTTVGATAFTLPTASQASNFSEGQVIMLGSFDLQHSGYPPNLQYYQYVTVFSSTVYSAANVSSAVYTSATGNLALTFATAPFGASVAATLNNQFAPVSGMTGTGVSALNGTWPITSTASAGTVINLAVTAGLGSLSISSGVLGPTGVITTSEAIEDQHRTDFPDYVYGGTPPGGALACGVARAWVIGGGNDSLWNIDHTYEGLQINLPPNTTGSKYWTVTGRRVTTIDITGCGPSESVAQDVHHVRPQWMTAGELDKMVYQVTYEQSRSPGIGLNVQSACPRILNILGGEIDSLIGLGQKTYARGVNITTAFQPGCQYGANSSAVFESCRIPLVSGFGGVFDGVAGQSAGLNVIDGTIASYSNGVITLNLALLGFNIVYWSVTPGMQVAIQVLASDSAALYPNDVGVGVVLSVTQDIPGTSPNYIYITIGGWPAALPSWASGKVYFLKCGPIKFNRCSGHPLVLLASDAAENGGGARYFEWINNTFTGVYGTSITRQLMQGVLVSVQCNVINPGSVSSATLVLTFGTYNNQSNFAPDTPGYTRVTFNIGVAGNRFFTTSALTGATGSDSVTVAGGSALTALPSNRALVNIQGTINTEPGSNVAAPLFTLKIKTDCGWSRNIVTKTFGASIGTALAVLGSAP